MATKRRAGNTNSATLAAAVDDASPSPITPTARNIRELAASAPNNVVVDGVKRPRRFKLLRSLALADFITLSNAACGTLSMFCCLNYLINHHDTYILTAFVLLPLALVFDIADGSVARWRQSSSPYGKDLDSLADAISFSAAPAVLAFTLGLRGFLDTVILTYFVCCGIGRLARFNVTALALSSGGGKVKYYQGFPVPTSVLLVLVLAVMHYTGHTGAQIAFGSYHPKIGGLALGTFHPFALLFFFVGSMEISEVKIPKP